MEITRTILDTTLARSLDGEAREADVVASSTSVDGHGEIVDVKGIDLKRYLANPVVLYGHDASQLPIGSAKNVRVDGEKLRATLKIVDAKASPHAETVWSAVKQGALRGVSIGFRSKERATQKRNGADVVVHTRTELLEISVVPIPSNPEAVIEVTRAAGSVAKVPPVVPRGLTHEQVDQLDRANYRLKMGGKTWATMSNTEKAELYQREPDIFQRLLREHRNPLHKGKRWSQLTVDEQVALYRTNRELAVRMMGADAA